MTHLTALAGARRMARLQSSPAIRHCGGRIDSIAWMRAEMLRIQYLSLATALTNRSPS